MRARTTTTARTSRARRTPAALGTVVTVVLAGVLAVLAPAAASAGTSGPGTDAAIPSGLTSPGSSAVGYIPPGLTTDRTWDAQSNTITDFTFLTTDSRARITARTDVGIRAALAAGVVDLADIRCWDEHAWNPTSDHPTGKACDLFQDYRTAAGVAKGWRAANWFVANQAKLGIYYVIWQNQFWGAYRPASWGPYESTVYGCPDATNITGCHMDHIHVSFY
jgi:hypothetical protein